MANNWDWLLTEDLYVTVLARPNAPEGNRVLVTDAGRRRAAIVVVSDSPHGVNLRPAVITINGVAENLGDAMPQILGLVDEAYEMGTGENFLPAPEGEYFSYQRQ